MGTSATTPVANPLTQSANAATAATPTDSTTAANPAVSGAGTANTATAGTGTNQSASGGADWYSNVQQQMAQNSQKWVNADPATRNQLHQQNLQLAASVGATWNPNTNSYDFPKSPMSMTPLWTGVDGQTKTSEGTNTLSNNGNSISTTVYQGLSYANPQDIAKIFGGTYKQDPTTGAITINGQQISPSGYDKNGNPVISVRQALGAMGYNQDQIQYDPKTKQITVQGNPGQEHSTYQSPMSGLMGMFPGMPPQIQPYQAPDLSGYYANLVPTNLQFNPNWNNYYAQAQAQTDPLTQNSINTLMNKQGMDITKADEGLNAKGIFNSGIAVAAENQIRANTSDQVAKVIMNASAQISKIAQTLYQDAEKQWSDGNHLALQNNQMWLTQAMDAQKQSFQQWLSTQQLGMQQYNYAVNAWDKMSQLALSDASNQMKANQFNQTQAWDQYKFGHLSADQQATQSLNAAKIYGYDATGRPTLDTWKALGYMPGPDGKLVPTLQATTDQKNYALNMAKALGFVVNADGSITPTEQAQHDAATIKLGQDRLDAQVTQWAAQNRIATDKNNITKDQLAEKKNYDDAMIQKAMDAQADTNKRTQLEGLKYQLDGVTKNMQTAVAGGQKVSDADVAQYNSVMNQIQTLTNPQDNATSNGTSGNNNGYDSFSGTPFAGN